MTAMRTSARRRHEGPTDFAAMTSCTRLELCARAESPPVRRRHVAALLAFTPTVKRVENRLSIRFDHGPTALWLVETLANRDVDLIDSGGTGGTVEVANPRIILGRYGFHDGRWVFGQGAAAALGISRGAVHAAGTFSGHGLKMACPTAPMMLTLAAVMSRLGIAAKPTAGAPRVAIAPAHVPAALKRLGIDGIAGQFRAKRESRASGDKR